MSDRTRSGTLFPPLTWLRETTAKSALADLIAGITLAAYAIPVSLAYASLAGLPPEVGVYGFLLGGLGYAVFGTSRQVAIGPTSAISLTVGATLVELSGGDAMRAVQIASLAAVTTAALCVIAWLLRLSALSAFISETNLLGFKAGAGLAIASTQLASFFGLPGGGDDFFSRLAYVARHLGEIHVATTLFGVTALVLLFLGGKFLPGRPVALAVVVLSIAAVAFTPLRDTGMKLAGAVTPGLPHMSLPSLRLRDVDGVIPLAFACLLLAYIEGLSAARTYAEQHSYEVDARQELLALGGANLLVGLGGGYAVAGGLSQTAVNDKAGARTPLSLVLASATLALCLLYLTGLVRDLPKTVLAAIVLVAVNDLIRIREIARLRRVSALEFGVALIALAGVLLLGILNGVMVAAVASLAMVIGRTASPHVAFLGRIPGTDRYSDLEVSPENEAIPGLLLVRIEAPLLYFNVDHVEQAILKKFRERPEVRQVIIDLSTSPNADLAGVRMLVTIEQQVTARGASFRFVNAHSRVRELLERARVVEALGPVDRMTSLPVAVEEFERGGAPAR